MRIKEVGYIVERLADRFRDLGGQMAAQEADHKTALEELRAGFNARTASDEHRLENLREEIIRLNDANGRLVVERDTLREEVAHLKTQLKPQTPKHPVKVGGWVRRTKLPGDQSPVGIVKQVTSIRCGGDSYGFADGDFWSVDNCEPCDPPEATHDTPEGKQAAESAVKREPKPGDVVRLVSVPTADEYPHDTGRWEPNWGGIGDYMRVHHIGNNINGTRIVRGAFGLEWPISCIEIVEDAK